MNKCTANLSKSHLYQKDAQKGFTLIEMMVVVAIMAILASIAIPNFIRQLAQQRTQQGATDIINLFNEARASAALSNKPAVIARTKDTANKEYTVSFVNRSAGGTLTTKRYLLNNSLRVTTDLPLATTELQAAVAVVEATPTGSIQTMTYVTTAATATAPASVTATPSQSTYSFRICDSAANVVGYSVWINARGIAKFQAGPVSGVANNAITNLAC